MTHIKLQMTKKPDKLSLEKTVVFVRIWMNIMIASGAFLSVLFYDSYYGANEARKMLRENNILYGVRHRPHILIYGWTRPLILPSIYLWIRWIT